MKRVLSCLVAGMLIAPVVRAQTTIVADVRAAIANNDLKGADELLAKFRQAQGTTPEALAALSWLGRGALAAGDNERAARYSQDTRQLVVAMLPTRPLDKDPNLQTALGAAIETEAKAMVATGQRASGVLFLRQQLARYRATPIRGRIQKNINLLSLEGQPAPPLTAAEHLGAPMPNMKGHPVVLFFWAHWCSDCKAEAPIIAALESQYRDRGLLVVGPTRRYGYAAAGADATPAQELAHIDQVRQQYYGMIKNMAVPVSNEDALGYGMDATPTLVLIDRAGKVALYHPGQMTREELEPQIAKLVAAAPSR
jgi:cytochrome c biogenesis protein CcmG/thiol:disulfide interchange protein DsbE